MSLPEDFSNHPRSIKELRSDKTQNGADWTPRDALIDMLREIDSGNVKPTAMVIFFREENEPGKTRTGFRNASADPHITMGLAMTGMFLMRESTE
jgi:hypothetical protein